jgi:hypothetical protein
MSAPTECQESFIERYCTTLAFLWRKKCGFAKPREDAAVNEALEGPYKGVADRKASEFFKCHYLGAGFI